MYLKSVEGKILFEGRFSSVKKGVEMAVEDGAPLHNIDLRQANLSNAQMDGAKMSGACFWGANLNSANMAGGNFQSCDFRTANLLNTCLAETVCHDADFSGSYFSRTIFRNADLSNTRFSCPSIFSVDLIESNNLSGAIYCHLGEVDCALSHAPLIIRGLKRPLVFMDDTVLVGTSLEKISLRCDLERGILDQIEHRKIL